MYIILLCIFLLFLNKYYMDVHTWSNKSVNKRSNSDEGGFYYGKMYVNVKII